ncbi:MAG: FkbM family methyltransferase [Planctomycetota bacterium]|jgi:FkbM family methyltransferase
MIPWISLAKWTSRFQRLIGWRFQRNGIGFLLRRMKRDTVLRVAGFKLHFNHRIAGGYTAAVAGTIGEPETQSFLASVLDEIPAGDHVRVIDVGANIGEITLGVASHERVSAVEAFEPFDECAKTCAANALLNGLSDKIQINHMALSREAGLVRFRADARAPMKSKICPETDRGIEVYASTLDARVADSDEPCIIKIDVEGAELDVLEGGRNVIRNRRPLIVFEYISENGNSEFSLDQVRQALGAGYQLFRLRSDGRLDSSFENTWNCVAVHSDSCFYPTTQDLIAA